MLVNRDRANEYMRQVGVEALIAASPVNVFCLSGYSCWVDSLMREYMVVPGGSDHLAAGTFALLTLDGHASLVADRLFALNAAQLQLSEINVFGEREEFDYDCVGDDVSDCVGDDVSQTSFARVLERLRRTTGARDPVEALVETIRANGLGEARIGIELSAMSPRARAEIADSLQRAELLECAHLLRLIRSVKSEEELRRLMRAAEINELVATECLSQALPGVSTLELAAHYRSRVAELGATIDHFAFGMAGLGIATELAYTLRAGDTMYMDFGCIYEGCYSDSGRTLSVGCPNERLKPTYEALVAAVERGAGNLRPGVRASSVQREMRRTLDSFGVYRSNPHGHGLGLEVRELPLVTPDTGGRIVDQCIDRAADVELEEGMVVNLESALFIPPRASLHIESSFLLTNCGSRPLVPQSRSEPFVSGAAEQA